MRCAGQTVTLARHPQKYLHLRKDSYKNYDLVMRDSNGLFIFVDLVEYLLSRPEFEKSNNLRPFGMVLTLDSGDIIVCRRAMGPMTWNEAARWERDNNKIVLFNPAQVGDIQTMGKRMMDFFAAYDFDKPYARLWTSIKDPLIAYINPIKNWAGDSEEYYVRRIIPMPEHLKRFEYPQ